MQTNINRATHERGRVLKYPKRICRFFNGVSEGNNMGRKDKALKRVYRIQAIGKCESIVDLSESSIRLHCGKVIAGLRDCK